MDAMKLIKRQKAENGDNKMENFTDGQKKSKQRKGVPFSFPMFFLLSFSFFFL